MVVDAKVNQKRFADWHSPQTKTLAMGGYSPIEHTRILQSFSTDMSSHTRKINKVGGTSSQIKPFHSKDIGAEWSKEHAIYIANPGKSESVGSQAFRLEYSPETPRQAIYDDVVTYLGEYRLQAKETFYDLLYSEGPDGMHIRDAKRGVAMVEPAKKAVQRGEKLERRKAELKALEIEDKFLENAEDGDILIQASPPGKIVREDGNYGFIFITKVEKINDKHKILHKNAVRIDNATIEQYNQAISEVTGLDIEHATAEEHIGNPHFLGKRIPYKQILNTLHHIFDFSPSAWERYRNEWIIDQTKPYIKHLADMIKQGISGEEAFNFLEKIENKVLDLKKNYTDSSSLKAAPEKVTRQQLDDFNNRYNYKPPEAGGSCGSTGSGELSSFARAAVSVSYTATSAFQSGGEDQYGSLTFNCPHFDCGFLNVRKRGKLIEICGQNASEEQGCGRSVRC